jgi:hypothetical protein
LYTLFPTLPMMNNNTNISRSQPKNTTAIPGNNNHSEIIGHNINHTHPNQTMNDPRNIINTPPSMILSINTPTPTDNTPPPNKQKPQ